MSRARERPARDSAAARGRPRGRGKTLAGSTGARPPSHTPNLPRLLEANHVRPAAPVDRCTCHLSHGAASSLADHGPRPCRAGHRLRRHRHAHEPPLSLARPPRLPRPARPQTRRDGGDPRWRGRGLLGPRRFGSLRRAPKRRACRRDPRSKPRQAGPDGGDGEATKRLGDDRADVDPRAGYPARRLRPRSDAGRWLAWPPSPSRDAGTDGDRAVVHAGGRGPVG